MLSFSSLNFMTTHSALEQPFVLFCFVLFCFVLFCFVGGLGGYEFPVGYEASSYRICLSFLLSLSLGDIKVGTWVTQGVCSSL